MFVLSVSIRRSFETYSLLKCLYFFMQNVKVSKKKPGSDSSPTPTVSAASTSSSSRMKSTHNASTEGINQAWFTTRDDKNALHKEG